MKTDTERLPPQSLSVNRKGGRKRTWLLPTLLVGAILLLVTLAALFAMTNPVLASIAGSINSPAPTQEILWASVDIAKPAIARTNVGMVAADPVIPPADALPSPPSDLQASAPIDPPGPAGNEESAVAPEATETPGTLFMEIVADDFASQFVETDNAQVQYSAEGEDERWIDVNLSEQRVYAYEGDTLVNSFLVSTGVAETPTVTGTFNIWIKVRIQDMSGPGYYLPDVPYVMYFYEDYGLHGTYWHNNFGTPMSRGCVNLTVDDAAWLFNWASVGTVVNVHY